MRTMKVSFFVIAFLALASLASAQPTQLSTPELKTPDVEAERLIKEIKPLIQVSPDLPADKAEAERVKKSGEIFKNCGGNPTCLEGYLLALKLLVQTTTTTSAKEGEVTCEGGKLVDGRCTYGEEVRVRAPMLTVEQQRAEYEKDLKRVIEEMRDGHSQEARRLGQEVREEDLKREARARLKEEVCGGKKLGIFGSRRDEYTCEGWKRIDFQENEAKEGEQAQKSRRAATHLSKNCWDTTVIENRVDHVIPFFSVPSAVLVFENPYPAELKVSISGDDNLPIVSDLCQNGSLALAKTIRGWDGQWRTNHYIIRAVDQSGHMYSVDSSTISVNRWQQWGNLQQTYPTYRIRFPEYDRLLQMQASQAQETDSGTLQGAPTKPGVRCTGPGSLYQRAIGNCSISNDMPTIPNNGPPPRVKRRY